MFVVEDNTHAIKTENGTGNRLADLIAQGKTELAYQHNLSMAHTSKDSIISTINPALNTYQLDNGHQNPKNQTP